MKRRHFIQSTAFFLPDACEPIALASAESGCMEPVIDRGSKPKDAAISPRDLGWDIWRQWRVSDLSDLEIYKITVSYFKKRKYGFCLYSINGDFFDIVTLKQVSNAGNIHLFSTIFECGPVPAWLSDNVKELTVGCKKLNDANTVSGTGLSEYSFEVEVWKKNVQTQWAFGGTPTSAETQELADLIIVFCGMLNFE